jgi:hypothetical protein
VVCKRAPGNNPKLTAGEVSGFHGLNQAARDECSDGVVAAMRQMTARLLQGGVHFCLGSLARFVHCALLRPGWESEARRA